MSVRQLAKEQPDSFSFKPEYAERAKRIIWRNVKKGG